MDYNDGGEVEVDGRTAVRAVLDIDTKYHHHAVNVGGGGDVQRAGDRLRAEVPEIAEVHRLWIQVRVVAVISKRVTIGSLPDVIRVGIRRRWHHAAGVGVEGASFERRHATRVPPNLLVESVVVA